MSDVDTPDLDTNAIPGANPDTNAAIAERENRWLVPTYGHIPMALVRGEDCHVWDAEGNRYLDLYGGHCVASVGHCHPKLVAAIQSQAAKLIFYSNVVYNDARAEAAEAIASIAPEGLQRIFFCNSGTEANETALKIARSHTGRRQVI